MPHRMVTSPQSVESYSITKGGNLHKNFEFLTAASKDVHIPPRRDTASYQAEAIVHEGREDRDVAGAAVPDTHAPCLLGLLVPHANNDWKPSSQKRAGLA